MCHDAGVWLGSRFITDLPPHQTSTLVPSSASQRGPFPAGVLFGGFAMAHKLYVGGLSFSTSDERLREMFAVAGGVESAAVVMDRDTGRSRGFGFVEMATAEQAADAVKQFNGTAVDGRTLKVEMSTGSGAGSGRSRG